MNVRQTDGDINVAAFVEDAAARDDDDDAEEEEEEEDPIRRWCCDILLREEDVVVVDGAEEEEREEQEEVHRTKEGEGEDMARGGSLSLSLCVLSRAYLKTLSLVSFAGKKIEFFM